MLRSVSASMFLVLFHEYGFSQRRNMHVGNIRLYVVLDFSLLEKSGGNYREHRW